MFTSTNKAKTWLNQRRFIRYNPCWIKSFNILTYNFLNHIFINFIFFFHFKFSFLFLIFFSIRIFLFEKNKKKFFFHWHKHEGINVNAVVAAWRLSYCVCNVNIACRKAIKFQHNILISQCNIDIRCRLYLIDRPQSVHF